MNKRTSNDYEEMSLDGIASIIRKNKYIIASFTIIGIIVGIIVSLIIFISHPTIPNYKATTLVEVVQNSSKDTQQQAVVNIMESKELLESTLKELKITESASAVEVRSQILSIPDTIEISVIYKDGAKAVEIANELRDKGMEIVRGSMTLSSSRTSREATLAKDPILVGKSVNYLTYIAIAGISGLVFSFFLVLFLNSMSNKIRYEEDVESYLGKKVLISIPDTREEKKIAKFFKVR